MSDERDEPTPDVAREERRLERVRVIALPVRDEYEDEEPPGPAAA